MKEDYFNPQQYLDDLDDMGATTDQPNDESSKETVDTSSEAAQEVGNDSTETVASEEGQVESKESAEQDPLQKGRERLEATKSFFGSIGSRVKGGFETFKGHLGNLYSKAKSFGYDAVVGVLATPELAQEYVAKPVSRAYEAAAEEMQHRKEAIKKAVEAKIEKTKAQIRASIAEGRAEVKKGAEDALKYLDKKTEEIADSIIKGFDYVYVGSEKFGEAVEAAIEKTHDTIADLGLTTVALGVYGINKTREGFRNVAQSFEKKYDQLSAFANERANKFKESAYALKNSFFNKINNIRLAWHESRQTSHSERAERHSEKIAALKQKLEENSSLVITAEGLLEDTEEEATESAPLAMAA